MFFRFSEDLTYTTGGGVGVLEGGLEESPDGAGVESTGGATGASGWLGMPISLAGIDVSPVGWLVWSGAAGVAGASSFFFFKKSNKPMIIPRLFSYTIIVTLKMLNHNSAAQTFPA